MRTLFCPKVSGKRGVASAYAVTGVSPLRILGDDPLHSGGVIHAPAPGTAQRGFFPYYSVARRAR